jgi:hypothetical protein
MSYLRVKVEVVDNPPQAQDFPLQNYAVIDDKAPFELIVTNNNTEGVNLQLLKAFLNLARKGKMTTASSGTGATDSVRTLIIAQHTAQIG